MEAQQGTKTGTATAIGAVVEGYFAMWNDPRDVQRNSERVKSSTLSRGRAPGPMTLKHLSGPILTA